jgi:hypothetical protein
MRIWLNLSLHDDDDEDVDVIFGSGNFLMALQSVKSSRKM